MPEVSDSDLASLPKLPAADLRLLWVNDWYDGPLEAVVEHAGERVLMVLHGGAHNVDVEKPMQWVLFRLSPEQWAEEEKWHLLFEEHVGHHWCFHHAEAQEATDPGLPRDVKRFYEPYAARQELVLDRSAAIGWVDEIPAH
jgi:hypothetical protein